jgi:hypothetical protein
MKYLQPSFTVYPPVRPLSKTRQKRKGILSKHEYTDIGGMCRFCALDKEGHKAKGYK